MGDFDFRPVISVFFFNQEILNNSNPMPPVANQILPNLWLGSEKNEHDDAFLKRAKIKHDIHCTWNKREIPGVKLYWVQIDDDPSEDIERFFPKITAAIDKALKKGEGVLVHCQMGISRSTTIVAAYLMWAKNMTAAKALAFIEKKRPFINPNKGFRKQLLRWQDTITK